MPSSRAAKTIGVLGHVGNQNLGDEALVAAVIQNVKRRFPDAGIRGFSLSPEDTRNRHGIPAFPLERKPRLPQQVGTAGKAPAETPQKRKTLQVVARARVELKKCRPLYELLKGTQKVFQSFLGSVWEIGFLYQSYRNLKGTDLLIVAGSQQLSDFFSGPWGNPYNLFRWSLLARLTGTQVAFLSVGAGPIRSRLSRFFIRRSLAWAHYRSFRDEASRKLVKELGVQPENVLFPDLVCSLKVSSPCVFGQSQPISRRVVGINPYPLLDSRYWAEPDPAIYAEYIQKLASFASWLGQKGHTVLFIPTQLRADPLVIQDICTKLSRNGASAFPHHFLTRSISSLEELLSAIAQADIVVANRYHGILFALLLNKPVLGIAYHSKNKELMGQFGLAEYALDGEEFELDSLIDRFLALESRAEAVKLEIAKRLDALRQAAELQYDRVFGLIEQRPHATK